MARLHLALVTVLVLTPAAVPTLANADSPSGSIGAAVSSAGALVIALRPGSAAAAAGLRPGDFIYAIGDTMIGSSQDLVDRLHATKPGTVLDVSFRRGGERFTARVTVEPFAPGKTADFDPNEVFRVEHPTEKPPTPAPRKPLPFGPPGGNGPNPFTNER